MSFHSTITDPAVWPADLVAADVVSAAADVYTGRRPQGVTRETEVWIEQLPSPAGVGQGMQRVSQHAYFLHFFRRGNNGGNQAGERNLDEVEAALHTIRERYHGETPFLSSVPGMVHAEVVIEEVDEDPGERRIQQGVARVTFTVAE